jgi:hypothetical protein
VITPRSVPCVSLLEDGVLALDVADFTECLPEDGQKRVVTRLATRIEVPDPEYRSRLLRLGGQRRSEQNNREHDGREPHASPLISASAWSR